MKIFCLCRRDPPVPKSHRYNKLKTVLVKCHTHGNKQNPNTHQIPGTSSGNTEPIVQYGGRLVLDSDESEDDDDGMPNKISKSKGPKRGFSGNKSCGNQGHGNKGSGKKSSGNKDCGNEGLGNKGSGNKCLDNKGIGKGKSKKKSESDHSNMSMEDLWKEGRNGQDSEKDTTDKGKVQTSFVGTMMKIQNLLSKSKDHSTDENENFQSERDMDFDSSRSGKCSRKLKNEENDEQVDNPLEDEAVPETGERDRVNEDEEDVYSNAENKDKKKKKKKKECQEESNDDKRSSPSEGEREKKKKKKAS